MTKYVISDIHHNHKMLVRESIRPEGYENKIWKDWGNKKQDDIIICLGDNTWGNPNIFASIIKTLPGYKILVRGNHDCSKSNHWWRTKGGFDFSCNGYIDDGVFYTHKPVDILPDDCFLNIHGHLHDMKHHEFHLKDHNILISLEHMGYQLFNVEILINKWKKEHE